MASVHSQPTGCPMVQLREQEPAAVYEVFDVTGGHGSAGSPPARIPSLRFRTDFRRRKVRHPHRASSTLAAVIITR
jgi:hypothetical protein